MDIIDSIILGIIQGLTEFLPVSSSGHLEIGKAILGDTSMPEESLMFTVMLHFATALSTIVVFRKDILDIIKGFLSFKWNDDTKFITKIVVCNHLGTSILSTSLLLQEISDRTITKSKVSNFIRFEFI